MILVTGSAGKTGRALLRALSARGEEARALVHRPEQARLVREAGAQEVVVGDMRDPKAIKQATEQVRAVYHIAPNMHPDEIAIGTAAINTASATGVIHFCYHSVLHPQTEDMPHHWQKLRVEEYLLRSGLPFTILQPTVYMQNILAQQDRIVDQGIYEIPYPAYTRLSMVDLDDVADAAATVLTEPVHQGATYELVGMEAIAQYKLVEVLSQTLGRSVSTARIAHNVWKQRAQTTGLSDFAIETLIKMFDYYEKFGFEGSPRVLTWLLGRPPTSLDAFVTRSMQGL